MLDIAKFDVILQMDWLCSFEALNDCYQHNMTFIASGGKKARFQGERPVVRKPDTLIAIFADIWSTMENHSVVNILFVVHEFTNVFLDELSGPPPPRKVEFTIDIMLRTMLNALRWHMQNR